MRTSRLFQLLSGLAVITCCLATSGCYNKVERLELSGAVLQGKITYNGKPVTAALVIVAGEGLGMTGSASNDGSYRVENVPLGEVRIGVNTAAAIAQIMGPAMSSQKKEEGGSIGKFVELPPKYFNPNSSGITTTISEGTNTFDIEL